MGATSFIAKKLRKHSTQKHTKAILDMGIASMSLCIAFITIALCILFGFKNEISQKVFGFGSHIQIRPYFTQNQDFSQQCISIDNEFIEKAKQKKDIKNIQAFATKGGLIKGEKESYGIIFKGVPDNYDTSFFANNILRGRMPNFETSITEILISEEIANKINLDTNSKARVYFIVDNKLRPRAFDVVGIYKTGLRQFDEMYAICNIKQIQRLNGWNENQVEGFDIELFNPENRYTVNEYLQDILPYETSSYTCDDLFPEIFGWLILVDANVIVLGIIITIVALISLIAILFISILERRMHIGIFKTLGASNSLVRNIFIRQTLYMLSKSMLIGNIVAVFICLIQKTTNFIKLDETIYFLKSVPISFPVVHIILADILIIAVAFVVLFITSNVLNKLEPIKNIK